MTRRPWSTRRTLQQRLAVAGIAVATPGMAQPRAAEAQAVDEIVVDGGDAGRVFGGVGAVSAGAPAARPGRASQ
ncbi:MAG: hypothetical protein H0V12_06610 [Chloroflexi bacterium]|nr:hypothetical protein [Chloroflexota bacterium]